MPTEFTVETFKAAYPELYAQIDSQSFQRGLQEGMEKGKKEGFASGADAERQRIQDVEGQLIAGHETLINTLKFDGKTTGPEAAVQVLEAERKLRTKKAEDFEIDNKGKVKNPDPGVEAGKQTQGETAKDADEAGKKLDTRAREIKADKKCSYRDALDAAMKEKPKLAELYQSKSIKK
jgi:hypothetical protein